MSVGGAKVGTVKHLPPTLTVQYHFPTGGAITPFLGAGLTWVTFFEEDTSAALGADIDLKDSWGLSVHAGFDYRISDRGAIRADLRWMDIDSEVSADGAVLGTTTIDPLVAGLSYIWKF